MSVSGIVLMTVCLANVLTIQAQYCPCKYNPEPFAPDKYYESFLPYETTFPSLPNNYQNHKQEPVQQRLLGFFPQEFNQKTAEEPKRIEVPKPSNETKQGMVKEQPNMYTKISIENATGRLEKMEEKDRLQYAMQEKVVEGSSAMRQKIIPYNNQHLQPSLLMPFVQQFHKPTVMGPHSLSEIFKPNTEGRQQKITENYNFSPEVMKQMANKEKEQLKKNYEMGLKSTQEYKGRTTKENKRMEGSSGQEQKKISGSHIRLFEIQNTGEKPATQMIIQRSSPPYHFNVLLPKFIGVEIL